MPTVYTAGIIDGEIKTFEQFAKKCMRAFGATIHMRDDSWDKEYVERTPSDYHTKKINEIKNKIKKTESLSDDEIVQLRTNELRSEIKRHNEALKKERKVEKKLKRMLQEAKEWKVPSDDYRKFKSFMIEQLEITVKNDGESSWRKEEVENHESRLTSIVASFEREIMLENLNKDLEYHEKEHKEEVQRCNDANEWVNELIKSL